MAAPNIDLDDVYVLPLAAPKVENATITGMMIKPAFPNVALPNGYDNNIEDIMWYLIINIITRGT